MAKKIDIYGWIYKYFQDNGVPENSEIQLNDVLSTLRVDIVRMEQRNLHTTQYTIADSLRQEIIKTMREMKAFDEESAVSATEIHGHNNYLASQRQAKGLTRLLKGAIDNNIITRVPRPDSKTHVKYYINKEYWNE